MKRTEFLTLLGFGTAAVACGACLQGCAPEDDVTAPPANVDFTLDLSAPANSALVPIGGYMYDSGLIIAHVKSGAYAAVSQACTHAGFTVIYDLSIDRFFCTNHGSMYDIDGTVTKGPATNPLKRYNTTLTGSSLKVFS